ncbi:universal stress protein [Haloarchaeobius sp. TZWWS8]|uniref:universal stress protein n=1 Tax=Haloarchaeobius sp. TZWWS8 TaxID=3446121 RepID=UPI003EBD61F3
MAEHVLVAYDDSPQSTTALDLALTEFDDAGRMTILTIIDPAEAGYRRGFSMPNFPEEWYENAKSEAAERLADAKRVADAAGRDIETQTVVGRPARLIVEYADEHDCDHIVMGSHGRSGVSRILLGSVAETVIRQADCPVTVVR